MSIESQQEYNLGTVAQRLTILALDKLNRKIHHETKQSTQGHICCTLLDMIK